MGQVETKEKDTDVEVPSEHVAEARHLKSFLQAHGLRLVDPDPVRLHDESGRL